ncbi:MAG: glycine cleavage system protein T [Planctomycetota bacterium]|nr:MAG: glycine cleavage system protein T [Planctomycetota bacterium]
MRETPLKEQHEKAGARMVPFGGWNMPVQYRSILEEARHVRAKVGLFDLCHMGRVRVEGPEAEAFLQLIITNDVTKIPSGAIRYACLTKEDGGVIDDVLVYRDPAAEGEFFVVINASNRERDLAWMNQHAQGFDCVVRDLSDEMAMIALQGPASEKVLQKLTDYDLSSLGYYKWCHPQVDGLDVSVSRTGYTGEDGFEIYYPVSEAARLWDRLLEVGQEEEELLPIGLGARDTLRLEAGMALYGHELSDDINPLEAGLQWAVRLKTEFIGRDALQKVKDEGPARKLIGLVTESRRVPRHGYRVLHNGEDVGHIASGSFSPVRDCNIATAFVRSDLAEEGTELKFQIRPGSEETATIVALPFYKRQS